MTTALGPAAKAAHFAPCIRQPASYIASHFPIRVTRVAGNVPSRCRLGPAGPARPASRQPSIITAAAATTAVVPGDSYNESLLSSAKRRLSGLLWSTHDREIWSVALPALVAMLLEPFMNAFNAGLVGHLGTQQLSAVSLGSLAVSFCTFLFSFLLFLTVPEIAAAVVKKDNDQVSCIAANSIWVALLCGVSSALALFLMAGPIVGALNPPEPAVAAYAVDYIKFRAAGIPVALLGFVATGVFRGFKDTRTPLAAAVVSAGMSLGLNVLCLKVLNMGVVGSALATTLAQTVSCALLMAALMRGGKVQARHLARPPPLSVVLPMLRLGAVMGLRNVLSFGMVLYASALCIRTGSATQASFEVIRQVWILTIQFFECLNVAAQALCATYLGKEDVRTAREVLARLVVLGAGVGALAGAGVWAAHGPVISFFTADTTVFAMVMTTLPLICAFFPVDAAASIMDGALMAAKQTNYMSAVQIAGSVVQYGVIASLAATGNINILTVWAALKILVIARLVGGAARNYHSEKSGYLVREQVHVPHTAAGAPPPAVLPPTAAEPAAAPPATAAAAATEEDRALIPAAKAQQQQQPQPVLVLHRGRERVPVPAVAAAEVLVSEGAVCTAAAEILATAAQDVRPLSSYEEDVVALACAACSSATDTTPSMLALRREQLEQQGLLKQVLAAVQQGEQQQQHGTGGAVGGAGGGGGAVGSGQGLEVDIEVPLEGGRGGQGAVGGGAGGAEVYKAGVPAAPTQDGTQ